MLRGVSVHESIQLEKERVARSPAAPFFSGEDSAALGRVVAAGRLTLTGLTGLVYADGLPSVSGVRFQEIRKLRGGKELSFVPIWQFVAVLEHLSDTISVRLGRFISIFSRP